jgi:hypothetical protein
LRIKKIILLISAIFLYGSWIPCAQATAAGGIESHWAKREIETVLNLGISANYPDGTFEPDQMITRAEFIKMLVTAGWIKTPEKKEQPTFKDVGREHWAYPYVEAAVDAGIVTIEGNIERFFDPDRAVTRTEMAALVGRLMTVEHLPRVPNTADNQSINWLDVLKEDGIILGYPDGKLEGSRGLTRAEACVIILRLKEQLLEEQIRRERQWISSAQSKDGYIALAGERQDIIPYFGNLTEMAQLGQPEYFGGVKKYLEWTLSNLNYPDSWGLNGTIYDRRLTNGVIQSVYSYDSADSYAATLLSLAAGYYRSSGDLTFIRAHYGDLSAVSEVVIKLQDADGLTWAKPNLHIKYLMDNCECYRGLKDWSFLLAEMGLEERSGLYDRKAGLIKEGILNCFWSEDTACFAWALDQDGGKSLPQHGQAYPGFFAQMYPVTYGVISPASKEALLAYQKLYEGVPGWAELEVGDSLPWVIISYAAVIMDDLSNADRFLHNCRSTYILNGRYYPWSTFEGAFYIRACDALQKNIKAIF